MNSAVTIYSAILFFILTPNILVRLPPKSSKFVVAATHAVIFALVFHFTCKIVWKATSNMFEGFSEGEEGMGPDQQNYPTEDNNEDKKREQSM